jgi:hypothetical protein
MPAEIADADAAHGVVRDATALLDWCAGRESFLEDENGEQRPVLLPNLIGSYREAAEQAQAEYFDLALRTLSGDNPSFTTLQVLAALERAGWTGPLRDFKLGVLAQAGRDDVVEVAGRGRSGGGRILRRVFRGFLGPLNAALESLDGIPGVGAIKELKDFVEGAEAASTE